MKILDVFLLALVFYGTKRECSAKAVTQISESHYDDQSPGMTTMQPEMPDNQQNELTAKPKRCARPDTLGNSIEDNTSGIQRRDLTNVQLKKCKNCMNLNICKNLGKCEICKDLCEGLEVEISTTTVDPLSVVRLPRRDEEIPTFLQSRFKDVEDENESPVVGAVLKRDQKSSEAKYYSLGAVESGPVMNTLAKIFNVPETFEKFILLGRRGNEDGNPENIIIFDFAQAFGNVGKTKATIYPINGVEPSNTMVDDLNKRIDDVRKTGNQLSVDDIQEIINEGLKSTDEDTVGSPLMTEEPEVATRCSEHHHHGHKDVIEVYPVEPPYYENKQKPIVEPEQYNNYEEEEGNGYDEKAAEEIKNPPVIQDNYNSRKALHGSSLSSRLKHHHIVGEDQPAEPVEEVTQPNYPPAVIAKKLEQELENLKPPQSQLPTSRMNEPNLVGGPRDFVGRPSSDNLVTDQNAPQGVVEDLTKRVFKVVDDSLKIANNGNDNSLVGQNFDPMTLKQTPLMSKLDESRSPLLEEREPQTVAEDLTKNGVNNVYNANIERPEKKPLGFRLRQPLRTPKPRSFPRLSLMSKHNDPKLSSSPEETNDKIGKLASEDSVKEENPVLGEKEPQIDADDLPKRVIKVVDDGLKIGTNGDNNQLLNDLTGHLNQLKLRHETPKLQTLKRPLLLRNKNPAFDSTNNLPEPVDNIVLSNIKKNLERLRQKPPLTLRGTKNKPPDTKDVVQPQPVQEEPTTDVPVVGAPNPESRSQFPKPEDSNYFGALVPVKEPPSGITDPKVKKLFYVGDKINLPLTVIQDGDGTMKLKVDTDALCNCQTENCTAAHVDDRFRMNLHEEDEIMAPELQVRFGSDDSLMESFVDNLHTNGEASDIFKRSPRAGDFERKLNIENEIEKMSEEIEKYNRRNTELLKKGTETLFQPRGKPKKAVELANQLLFWLRDSAMNRIDS